MKSFSKTCSCKTKHEANHSCEQTNKDKQETKCCSSSNNKNKTPNEHHHATCAKTDDDGEEDSDSAHSSGGCCGHEHVISPLLDISPISDASDFIY